MPQERLHIKLKKENRSVKFWRRGNEKLKNDIDFYSIGERKKESVK